MKQTTNITLKALCAAPLAAFLLLCQSCEDKSATETSIKVSPGYTELREGQSVTLTATGWDSYRWTLAQPTWGVLSGSSGDSVQYTATRDSDVDGSSVNQTITAIAASTGLSVTNGVTGINGSATVRHLY